jgi:hypothetical protein
MGDIFIPGPSKGTNCVTNEGRLFSQSAMRMCRLEKIPS